MATRIFISYRSADGRDKATALARDLGERFGPEQVFLDKDDLPAGGAWRQDLARHLNHQAVVLLLLTPQYLGATTADGQARIEQADDPLRRELQAALDGGARVVPLLCDDTAPPVDAATLPPPFHRIAEFTFRPLRAYDWVLDLQRLGDDLAAMGVPQRPRQRRLALRAGAAVLVLAAAGATWWALRPPPQPLVGRWLLHGAAPAAVAVSFSPGAQPGTLQLDSAAVDIRQDPAWRDYRAFWRERFGAELDQVVWRGQGQLLADGLPSLRLDMALQVRPAGAPHAEPIATGSLGAELPATGRGPLRARLWWNAEQRWQDVQLQPQP